MKNQKDTYGSGDIKNLQFPESVRTRPGMYIGATDSAGVMTILREILDNCVDECLVGHASTVDLAVGENAYWIADDGRGIPAGTTEIKNPADGTLTKIPTARAVFGVPSAGFLISVVPAGIPRPSSAIQ